MKASRRRTAVISGQPVKEALLDQARDMRRTPTEGEMQAWHILRGRRLDGLKFRRQQPIAGFIADFYCAEHRLIIEIDGGVHDSAEREAYDSERGAAFAQLRVKVVRVRTGAVSEDTLRSAINSALSRESPPLP